MTDSPDPRTLTSAPVCGIGGCQNEPEHPGDHWSPALALIRNEHAAFLARKHDGKRPYDSKAGAKRAAGMTSATFGGRPKMAYRCPVCGSWHVGERS
jgi:hypothetical protein